MAFLASMAGVVVAQNKQALAQTLVVDKKSVQLLAGFIRDNTKKYWKPLAGAAVIGTCVYGAIKIRSEILLAREELKFNPTTSEAENLIATASNLEVGARLDQGMLGELDGLADELLEEFELDECLEVDPTYIQLHIDVDSIERANSSENKEVAEAIRLKMEDDVVKKSRKRVRSDRITQACKSMVSKVRASFPVPDGTPLQQKAMALYLAKEGRKLKIRETQLAVLIPRAVAIASVPTNAQIDTRLLMNIEPVKFKFGRMKWQGVQNERSWLSKLVATLPLIQ